MKISKNIYLKEFKYKKNKKIILILRKLISEKNLVISSLGKSYSYSYNKKLLNKLKKYSKINLIGMGGSSLGARSIYNFLKKKIKKEFNFNDNLSLKKQKNKKTKNLLNLIISKSGNTLETIVNTSIFINKNQKNVFLTENRNSYLFNLAKKLKSEIIFHNNYIGGRYSVLSEVGMLPAELMGLNETKFKQYDNLIKNKNFLSGLVSSVSNILDYSKKGKTNSIILNYDENSNDLFYWYQQLVAESLGKKGKGILPIVSNLPKDNHSLMQLYLDGTKNNFFTLFFVNEKSNLKINSNLLLKSHDYLKGKNLEKIKEIQFNATQNVFKKKNIPFRSLYINKRSEETLGELFTFFILETILVGKALKINPFDQPAVELIKNETKKIF
jgi:glucose-6-phosphate isomerase